MSIDYQRTPDPTQTGYMRSRYAQRWSTPLDSLAVTMEAISDTNLMIDYFEEWLVMYEQLMVASILVFVDWAIRRGASYASTQLNRLSPDWQTGAGWTPADDQLRDELTEEIGSNITDFISDLNADLRGAITSGKPMEQIIIDVQKITGAGKTRAVSIAQTEIIHVFNETVRRRWKAWGVKKYRFWTSLDPKVCDEPKKLRDNTVVMGCESLHNKVYDIDDVVHLPPIHPWGRCTILPVIGEEG